MATLRLVPVSGSPIEVTRDGSVVGRDPSCDIVVTDGSVSRRHAHLELRSGVWHVVDQGSANGTYLNSLRVADTALKQGQELRFGALAFRVDIVEDPEATVASPLLRTETDTVMAPSLPPSGTPTPPSAPPRADLPPPPPPPRAAALPPPPPPSSAASRERFRPAGASPVPPMAGGAPPARKGRGPVFWILIGCCGCILVAGLLGALVGGGAWMMTKGAADAAHGWIAGVRAGGADAARSGMSSAYRSRVSDAEVDEIVAAIQASTDSTLPGRQVQNDRATVTGVLTGPDTRSIVLKLVKEGGGWMVDDVELDGGFGTFDE